MRVVQVANFYGPRSGGLRTAVDRLGAEYCATGREVFLIVPGPGAERTQLPTGVVRITLPARLIPFTDGYRAVMPGPVKALLAALKPNALEVSDRLTLRSLGRWGREYGATTVMISHERLDRLVGQILPRHPAQKFADFANTRTAADYDTVVRRRHRRSTGRRGRRPVTGQAATTGRPASNRLHRFHLESAHCRRTTGLGRRYAGTRAARDIRAGRPGIAGVRNTGCGVAHVGAHRDHHPRQRRPGGQRPGSHGESGQLNRQPTRVSPPQLREASRRELHLATGSSRYAGQFGVHRSGRPARRFRTHGIVFDQ